MKYLNIANTGMQASEIALGCMRIAKMSDKEIDTLVQTALDNGINFFDHADIYGGGKAESRFAEALDWSSDLRERIILQTKCGIRKGMFDFSKEHILASVDGSLQRLQTDYLDVLLLHRPDTLVEPEEVADAFSELEQSGKVRYFGVSNQHPMQIALLQRFVKQPLLFNQLQFSITNTGMIDAGLNVNMENAASIDHDGGILDYCRLHNITIQPWSPFQYGFFEGVFVGNEKFPELNTVLDALAEKHGISPSAMAIAWILRHPAHMQPIIGTTNPQRLHEICAASAITLSRVEWYEIYRAAGNTLP
jgi:predicted oxidoreductase